MKREKKEKKTLQIERKRKRKRKGRKGFYKDEKKECDKRTKTRQKRKIV